MARQNQRDDLPECDLPPELACLAHPSQRERLARGNDRDELAPDVDEGLIRALVRRELAEEDARAVYRLIHVFDSWNQVHARIIIEEFRKSGSDQLNDGA
jgi:hypothetical protein